jgi:leucyl-tRNA synthetase
VSIGASEKMSKSKNNGVDPQLMIDKFGADTVRLFSMFASPPDQSLEWNEAGVEGMARFLRRFWREVVTHAGQPDHPPIGSMAAGRTDSLPPPAGEGGRRPDGGHARAESVAASDSLPPPAGEDGRRPDGGHVRVESVAASDSLPPPAGEGGRRPDGGVAAEGIDPSTLNAAQKAFRRQLHETIAKVGDDIGRRRNFNTAIAALMELLNAVARFDDMSDAGRAVRHEALEAMVLLLNPFTPHASHALWQVLGHQETLIEDVPWPKADPAALVRSSVTLAVQVNGRLRGTLEAPLDAAREQLEAEARALPGVVAALGELTVRKVIVVPGKIVNIVAN